MRAIGFLIGFLVCSLLALSAMALEPMGEAEMDSVQAQSGIAIGLDNIQVYRQSGWAYEATSGGDNADANKKIEFFDSASYLILNTRNPITFRVIQNPDGHAMMELTGQSSIWMEQNINAFSFAGEDMGSLHMSLRPPTEDRMGFMEEFLLYVAPHGVFFVDEGDGIAFQLELRSDLEELLWDYNKDEDDAFWLRGVQLADTFDEEGNPGDGRFMIGNLDAYDNGSAIDPATFQVVPDTEAPEGEGYAMLRLNLPMEGSARIDEIGIYTDPDDDGTFAQDDFGPMVIDNMKVHHLQIDFRTFND